MAVEIEVRVYATLRRHYPHLALGEAVDLRLEDGATLADLLNELDLPREEIKVVFVNGRRQGAAYRLQPGDRVGVFPPVGGG